MPAKILVVEDDLYLRELYAEVLKKEGYDVETAADGDEGYAKVSKGGWDLILMDIVLPKMNGLDILRKVSTEPAAKTNKSVVFLTNLDNADQMKEALLLGDAYLIKSQVTPGNLTDEIKKYIK
ncbi:MAG: response regulator [Patescibacteria group bacterium]|nr:response regulator [Patescibacteria group bacterium]